jgi:hypothetical protein
MKLYTEQEVRDAIDMAREGVRSKDGIIDTLNFIKPPIELPSDEEIEKANPFVFGSKHLGTRDMDIWELGAIWMRDKIKGDNK